MSNKYLKDCPFCGGKAIRIQHPGQNWDGKQTNLNIGALHGLWYVGCPAPFFEEIYHCDIHPAASWYAKLEDAENDWNKRDKE